MRTSLWMAVVVGMFLAQPACADEGSGWQFPNLNPFKSREAPPPRAQGGVSDESAQGGMFHLPKPSMPRMPWSQEPGMASAPKPNPFQRLNTGARGFLTKTRDTITAPFAREDDKPPTSLSTASRPADDKGSFFPPWRRKPAPTEPEQEIRSANDFLRLPRVQP